LSREVSVKMSDLIDITMVFMQSKVDVLSLTFLLDLFPDDVNDEDFKKYFEEYELVTEYQRPAMEDLANCLKMLLVRKNKWGDKS